jgi:ArsR family transcriptional regulator, virulence genes transcriptional regulator
MDLSSVEDKAEIAATLLKAISNDKRLLILCALHRGEKNVGELEKIIGLSQSALSQHLARLRRDGIVETRRDAQTVYYSLSNKDVKIILQALYDIYGCPTDGLV